MKFFLGGSGKNQKTVIIDFGSAQAETGASV